MKINFKKHEKKWERMARTWKIFGKPGRPSKDDMKIYFLHLQYVLRDIKEPKILLLGSTPEIRDMLVHFVKKSKAEVICADMTKNMYRAMSGIVKKKNTSEKFVKVNWLQLSKKIKLESIDAVLGDYVIGNVGEYEEKFFKEVVSILKKGGAFITRAQIMDGIKNKINLRRELDRASESAKKKKMNVSEASSQFANNLILYAWHLNKENKISLSYIGNDKFNELEKYANSSLDKMKKKVLDRFYNSWWLMRDKYWTNYKRKDLERIIKKYFKIKKAVFSSDYDIAEQSPIYLLKK